MHEMGKSYYAPENAVEIKNQTLQSLILEAIAEKSENPAFLVDGNIVVFPANKFSLKQLNQYRKKLVEWAINPFNLEKGIEGHGLEILIKLMLKELYKENKDIVIFQSPATVDFIDNQKYKEWEPTNDIIIGRKLPNGIKPIVLINTSLSKRQGQKTNHKLGVPIITVRGDKLFENKEREQLYLCLFASHPNPAEYAITLAQRSPFKERLGKKVDISKK